MFIYSNIEGLEMKNINFPTGTKIMSVEEYHKLVDPVDIYCRTRFTGYKVSTTAGDIILAIDDAQQCYEDAGYDIECKEEDLGYYKGATILSIDWDTDVDNSEKADSGRCVRIRTTRGDIDLWVYNIHNGYYAHSCIIKAFSEVEEFDL